MVNASEPVRINRSAVEQLTIDAMLLADEAESYFAEEDPASLALPVEVQVQFACEAFRTNMLLRQLIGRLQKPAPIEQMAGLRDPADLSLSDFELLPPRARAIVAATRALYGRARDLEAQRAAVLDQPPLSPAKVLQDLLFASLHS